MTNFYCVRSSQSGYDVSRLQPAVIIKIIETAALQFTQLPQFKIYLPKGCNLGSLYGEFIGGVWGPLNIIFTFNIQIPV